MVLVEKCFLVTLRSHTHLIAIWVIYHTYEIQNSFLSWIWIYWAWLKTNSGRVNYPVVLMVTCGITWIRTTVRRGWSVNSHNTHNVSPYLQDRQQCRWSSRSIFSAKCDPKKEVGQMSNTKRKTRTNTLVMRKYIYKSVIYAGLCG